MKNVLRRSGRVRDRERFRSNQVAAATAPQVAEFLIRKLGCHTNYSRARVRVGPTKYTNQTNEKDLASKLSVSSCVSWAKKILCNRCGSQASHQGHEGH